MLSAKTETRNPGGTTHRGACACNRAYGVMMPHDNAKTTKYLRFMIAPSAIGEFQYRLGQPFTLHGDLGGALVDLAQVVRRQLDIRRGEVLLEPVQLRRTGDRYDPWLLREQPGQSDLRRRG